MIARLIDAISLIWYLIQRLVLFIIAIAMTILCIALVISSRNVFEIILWCCLSVLTLSILWDGAIDPPL